MVKPKITKTGVLFYSSIVLLLAAGAIWFFNGLDGKIKLIVAHEQDPTAGSNPGDFSEEWIATEVTGDATGWDNLVGSGSAFTFQRIREISSISQLTNPKEKITYETWYVKGAVDELIRFGRAKGRICDTCATTDTDGITRIDWGDHQSHRDGHLGAADYSMIVTKWKVNGHIH